MSKNLDWRGIVLLLKTRLITFFFEIVTVKCFLKKMKISYLRFYILIEIFLIKNLIDINALQNEMQLKVGGVQQLIRF